MYSNGQGVPQDYIQAYKWINLAAAQDNKFVKNRNMIEAEMTKKQKTQQNRSFVAFSAIF